MLNLDLGQLEVSPTGLQVGLQEASDSENVLLRCMSQNANFLFNQERATE